jgi:hypothetical protein
MLATLPALNVISASCFVVKAIPVSTETSSDNKKLFWIIAYIQNQ